MSKLHGIAQPKELTTLAKALEEHCAAQGIQKGTEEWEAAAARAMNHFLVGASELEAVKKALEMTEGSN